VEDEEGYILLLMKILEERSYKISSEDYEKEEGDFEENPWKPENVYLDKPYTI
jgi:hypothetical protein